MMIRTQLSFEPEVLSRARERAAQLGVSLAEYVRRVVAEDLGGGETSTDASTVFDLGRSERSDVARAKDDMLGASFDRERSK